MRKESDILLPWLVGLRRRRVWKLVLQFWAICSVEEIRPVAIVYMLDLLCQGKSNRVVGYKNGQFVDYDIDEALAMQKCVSPYMLEVARDMSN